MIRELRSAGIVGVVGAILNPHDSTATVAYIPFLTVNLFLYLYILNEINLIVCLTI